MLSVTFCDVAEIRMGSPFNSCRLSLNGDWIPEIGLDDYQDKYAESPGKEYLALVKWDVKQNNPGFRLVIVDSRGRTVTTSSRVSGCCQSLEWVTGGFRWATSEGKSGIVAARVAT